MISRLLIPLAFSLTSGVLLADQTDDRLDDLFATLQQTEDVQRIRFTESQIWEIWLQHANADVEQLMLVGTQRMNTQRYAEAMVVFNRLIENFPDYAEGWNKRATLNYALGNFDASISDIREDARTRTKTLRRAVRTWHGLHSKKGTEQGEDSLREPYRSPPEQPQRETESGTGGRAVTLQCDLENCTHKKRVAKRPFFKTCSSY